jgi:hypothetical protein
MKGGIILRQEQDLHNSYQQQIGNPSYIFDRFLRYCQHVRILTDNSISGITLHFYDCPEEESPYMTVRSNNVNEIITECLLKVNIIDGESNDVSYIYNRFIRREPETRPDEDLEIQTRDTIRNEVTIQQDLYARTLKSPNITLQPICPGIICYSIFSNTAGINRLRDIIIDKLQEREYRDGRPTDTDIINNLFNIGLDYRRTNGGLGLIAMEMMNGYDQLNSFIENPMYDEYKKATAFELLRLANYGYKHMDAHGGNILINPNLHYFGER